MNLSNQTPSREDVLNAFSLEEQTGREILSHYIRSFPEYANDLIDLSLEMTRRLDEDRSPLSSGEQALVEAAWQRHLVADPFEMVDVLSAMSVPAQKELSQALGVSRQVITALRERRALAETIKGKVLRKIASVMNVTSEHIAANLRGPCQPATRAYKSDQKPNPGAQVSFEQILIDAGVPLAHRNALMADED